MNTAQPRSILLIVFTTAVSVALLTCLAGILALECYSSRYVHLPATLLEPLAAEQVLHPVLNTTHVREVRDVKEREMEVIQACPKGGVQSPSVDAEAQAIKT